jgi:hypothetical protein
MMMAEHHVGHVPGLRTVRRQRGHQLRPRGHHARVHHDHRVAVQDQRDRPGYAAVVTVPADIPLMQHEH